MSSAGSARSFCCLGRAMVGLRTAGDSRLGRWGSSAQRGVRVLSAGRNTGSGADSVNAVKAGANFLHRLGERTEFFRHRERFLETSLHTPPSSEKEGRAASLLLRVLPPGGAGSDGGASFSGGLSPDGFLAVAVRSETVN
jgi:hypothetical protein